MVGHWLGIIALVIGGWQLWVGAASLWWLVPVVIGHVWGSLTLSVGNHRYFAHGAFKTSRLWHNVLAFSSIYILNGSPQGWAVAHNTHHRYADTDRDIHYGKLSYLFLKIYRRVPMVMWRLKRMNADATLNFVHRFGALVWILTLVPLALFAPQALLYCVLVPLGLVNVIGALHQALSHWGGKPRNLAFLEFVLPACGEWMHKTHHEHAQLADLKTQWWHVDLGYRFIQLIRCDENPTKR